MKKDIWNKAEELTDEDVEKVAGGAGEGDGAEGGTGAECRRDYNPDSTECQNCSSPCMLSKWDHQTLLPDLTQEAEFIKDLASRLKPTK
jgi:hypothetical protein